MNFFQRKIPPVAFFLLISLIASGIVALTSIGLAREYYLLAPHHYDSASYLAGAIYVKSIYDTEGAYTALKLALATKDSLDLSIRVLLAPGMLGERYGHLVVLLPFFFLFIYLVSFYIYKKRQSLPAVSLGVVAFFSFYFMYHPYMGMADYWKDNLAVWLYGSAILSWFLSDDLERRGWAFCCGVLLGMLVMQRTALAMYAAINFFLPALGVVFKSWREERLRRVFGSMLVIAIPAAVLAAVTAYMQWSSLYRYYFIAGYGWSTPFEILRSCASATTKQLDTSFYIFLSCLFLFIGAFLKRREWNVSSDTNLAAWFVVGLPLAVVLTHSAYPEFGIVWPVLLGIFFVVLVSETKLTTRSMYAACGLAMGIGALVEYGACEASAMRRAHASSSVKELYGRILDTALSQPEPRRLGVMYDEDARILQLEMWFERHISQPGGISFAGFTSVHDSYYRAKFGELPIERYYSIVLDQLETQTGTMVVAQCAAEDVVSSSAYGDDAVRIAIPVASMLANHFAQSDHWSALARLESRRGCLQIYKYSSVSISPEKKWSEMSFDKPLERIDMTLPLGTSVRLVGYETDDKPEFYNGIWVQWMAPMSDAVRLSIISPIDRRVKFLAHATVGDAEKGQVMTFAITENGSVIASQTFRDEADIELDVPLKARLNVLNFAVDIGRGRKSGSSKRALLLWAPRFVPGAEHGKNERNI